jgi:PRTRC genetic system ThiF family protein
MIAQGCGGIDGSGRSEVENMSYTVAWGERLPELKYIIVGCGGTGSMVAEGLSRLLLRDNTDILLIDNDRVEPHNLKRQNFFPGDEGKFKSQALAERLSRQYGRRIGYSVLPFDPEMKVPSMMGRGFYNRVIQGLIIGCVDDTTDARSLIGKSLSSSYGNWWLDAGNGHHSGQVLLGNTPTVQLLEQGFDKRDKVVYRLPMPSLQEPALLIPPNKELPQEDCAEAVETEEQSPVINQVMATWVLQFIDLLRKGKLTWMGVYIDIEAGTTRTIPADPEVIAKKFSVKVDTLIRPEEPMCHIGKLSSPLH